MGASGGGRGPERQRRPPSQEPGKGGMNVDIIMEILDKLQFFGGQRAGRELWADKPTDVQDDDIDSFNENIEAIRDYIQQLEAKVPRWISVEERLPDVNVDVVLIIPRNDGPCIRVGWLRESGRWWAAGQGLVPYDVTHWMPLPEPPKED